MPNKTIANPNFFKNNTYFDSNNELDNLLNDTIKALSDAGLDSYKKEIENLFKQAEQNRFTVAVVGEFSRGKSSFINNLFEKDMLPVANTPTTALLTRIRYNEKEALVFINEKGKKTKAASLSSDSWDGYVADIDGNDFRGVAFAGVNSDFLKEGIEFIDTPGAGDLEDSRTQLIDDALRGSNAAIITISAESPLSLSEKLFIEERLISKKTPFLMLIITKLDLIPRAQRRMVVEHIQTKLKLWGINVPVFIPYDIDIPNDKFADIIGMDKIKNKIIEWTNDPQRKSLTEDWLLSRAIAIIESAIQFLSEQQLIANCDDSEKEQLISKKNQLLETAVKAWDDMRNDMILRLNESYEILEEKKSEFSTSIEERLLYDLSHTSNPQKWWSEDYPYKVKLELTHMSTAIENLLSRKIAEDARNFNAALEKSFKAHILYKPESITDKSIYNEINVNNVQIADLGKKRTIARIGVSALSIVSYVAFAAVGIPPIIGSTGISTGGALVSENIFKNKVEEQKAILRQEITKALPNIICTASIRSKSRIKAIYDNIINEAEKHEKNWLARQEETLDAANNTDNITTNENITALTALCEKIKNF